MILEITTKRHGLHRIRHRLRLRLALIFFRKIKLAMNGNMKSSLTWVDHDQHARERTLRILSLFQERESRDELGLGSVRDSFADHLFPGDKHNPDTHSLHAFRALDIPIPGREFLGNPQEIFLWLVLGFAAFLQFSRLMPRIWHCALTKVLSSSLCNKYSR
jgi:hypothetical protein